MHLIKRMSTDLGKKLPKNVNTGTCHSYAFGWAIRRYEEKKLVAKITTNKIRRAVGYSKIGGFSKYKEANLYKLCITSFCYSHDRTIGADHIPYDEISFSYDTDILKENETKIIEKAQAIWRMMIDNNSSVPLGHDGYLKLWALTEPQLVGDFIFVDEAQDLNPAMLEVVNNYMGQKVIVGDSSQQIYEWRGAVDAMAKLQGICRCAFNQIIQVRKGV